MTLPLPAPALEMIAPLAQVQVLGHLPAPDELAAELGDEVDVLCCQLRDRVSREILSSAPARLRGICNYAAGFDNVDVPAATELGVWVTNTPDVVSAPTAELTIGLMLAASRRIVEGDAEVRAGRFTGWRPDYLLGGGLSGKRLGVVGLGRIGAAVARAATALGMSVCTARTDDRPSARPDGSVASVSFGELLATSDIVSLHAPLTVRTRHLIAEAELRTMKSTAILVNTSRGPLVDEAALACALAAGDIWAAALDVYEREPQVHPALLALPNVILAPHLGTATREARADMASSCARNVVALLRGEDPPTPVNRPAARMFSS
jgi:glyoxylate reductase